MKSHPPTSYFGEGVGTVFEAPPIDPCGHGRDWEIRAGSSKPRPPGLRGGTSCRVTP